MEVASPAFVIGGFRFAGSLFLLLARSSLLIVQAMIKLAQSFARRDEGSVRHAVAGSIDQSKGKHGHDIVRY